MLKSKINHILKVVRKLVNMLVEPVIGYTRVVFATKFILSAIAIVLVLTLVVLPLINPVQDNYRITFSHIETDEESSAPKMVKPRFQGVDKDNQTYNISAKTATKIKDEILVLDSINASIELQNGTWVLLNSNKGVLKHKENYLELSETVYLFTNDGYEFYTDTVYIDIKKNMAYSDTKVTGKGPAGTIEADSVKAYNKGQRTIFEGNVKVVLYPERIRKIPKQDK
jgi:lipopolysaccharide export system protein LptC